MSSWDAAASERAAFLVYWSRKSEARNPCLTGRQAKQIQMAKISNSKHVSNLESGISNLFRLKPESSALQGISDFGFRISRPRAGFTALEMVIVIAIIVIISTILLVRFPTLSQTISLQRSARELGLALRKAQNMAFAVRVVEAAPGTFRAPAGGYGVYFGPLAPAGSYLIFADVKVDGSNRGRYSATGSPPDQDVVVETVAFGPGISVDDLVAEFGAGDDSVSELHIAFTSPEARMTLSKANGATGNGGEAAQILLTDRSGALSRNVVVRTTGQIRIR